MTKQMHFTTARDDCNHATSTLWSSSFRVPRIANFILVDHRSRTSQRRARRAHQQAAQRRRQGAPSAPTTLSPSRTVSFALSLSAASVMDAAVRAAGMADLGADPADQEPIRNVGKDEETGGGGLRRSSVNNSRASLPLSHHRSFSLATSRHRANSAVGGGGAHEQSGGDANDAPDDDGEELEWGPSHPCFPHANPHVPRDSPEAASTRIIRIKRDWMQAGDLAPTFSTLYPEILDPFVPEDAFRELTAHVNSALIRITDPFRSRNTLDGVLGFLTGWLWEDLGLTAAKRELAGLEAWIAQFARRVGPDARIVPLKRTAYLSLDIQIPDPQISADGDPDAATTEADGRSIAGRSLGSQRRRNYTGRVARTPGSRPASTYSSRGSAAGDDYAPPGTANKPVVPPIPDKYLAEAAAAQQQHRSGAGGAGNSDVNTKSAVDGSQL